MSRQLILIVFLLLGLGAIHTAGTRRPQAPGTSDDPYAWLGPAPSQIDEDDVMKRWLDLGDKVRRDIQHIDDMRNFVCKKPAEIGPVPMMDAVEGYMNGAPESRYDKQLMQGLYEAAAKGNWLARVQLFHILSNDADDKAQYRALQLAEWMLSKKLGQLYAVSVPLRKRRVTTARCLE